MLGVGLSLAGNGGCSGGFDDCRASRTCKGPTTTAAGGFGAAGASAVGQAGAGYGGALFANGGASAGGSGEQAGAQGAAIGGEAGQGGAQEPTRGGAENSSGEAGAAGNDAGRGGEPAVPDTTPPEIVSVVPEDGAHGVRIDSDIVVTFSESMDRPETEASFQGDAFLPSHTTFTWSDNGKVMSIHSPGSLEYADVSADAREYSFSITTFARDLAGNHLFQTQSVSFDTGHTGAATLGLADARIVHHAVPGPDQIETPCTGSLDGMTNSDALLLTFSFEGVAGADAIVDFVSAELGVPFDTTSATLVSTDLEVDHVSIDREALTWDPPVLGSLGSLSVSRGAIVGATLDVSEGIRDDLVNRAARSDYTQYLIHFADTAASQSMAFHCTPGFAGAAIDVEYVTP